MRKCISVKLLFDNEDFTELSRQSGLSIEDIRAFVDARYKPTEPLIEDEKARKAVRAWAEANMIDSVTYDKDEDCIYLCGLDKTDLSMRISFDDVDVFEALEHKRSYTIAELCGEEE